MLNQNPKPHYELEDLIALELMLAKNQIQVWLDGGWAVDALLGEQTRVHEDVDIIILEEDLETLRALLETQGYQHIKRDDTHSWNFVLGDPAGHQVDFHVIRLDPVGNGLYGPIVNTWFFPAASLTGKGNIGGLDMHCISAEYLVKFHSGYKLDENDYRDISAICSKFQIPLPEEYRSFEEKKEIEQGLLTDIC
jgi:lincosamide nucleotidyltransferase A/C/D/E